MSAPAQASGVPVTTFSVRLPAESKKKYSIMKFNAANNVDFTKCAAAKIGRENNLSDFKSAYDIETMPKFGAGSEYGREQREEARKKKFGMRIKKYNSDEQPWLLNLNAGSGKPLRRFKGTREGGISENASFFIFMQCPDAKAFEAYPVEEWYSFAPQIRYRYLDIEEAEDEYNKRDKTLNYFNVMLRKRLKNEEEGAAEMEEGETSKKKTSTKTDKSLLISEFDEMSQSSDDEADDDSGKETKNDEEKRGKNLKKKSEESRKQAKKLKKKKTNGESDEELMEESDDLDEGEEVDYISGSSSNDEQMYDDKGRDQSDKYQDKGVEDEEGLRKLVDSADEEEEDEDKKDDEMEEDEESRQKDDKAKTGSDSSDTSSDSDSDSDPEKDNKFASALFMMDRRNASKAETSGSRPSTPSSQKSDNSSRVKKRKADNASPLTVTKKPKSDTLVTSGSSSSLATLATASSSGASNEGIMEEAVRRYLMRKPMTTKDLVQKFKSHNASMTKEQMTTTIAQILKRINPQKTKINDKLYLSIKKDS